MGSAAAAGPARLTRLSRTSGKSRRFRAAEPLSAGIAQDGSAILQSTRNKEKSCFLAIYPDGGAILQAIRNRRAARLRRYNKVQMNGAARTFGLEKFLSRLAIWDAALTIYSLVA